MTEQLFEVTNNTLATIGSNATVKYAEKDVLQVSTFPHEVPDSPPIEVTTDQEHRGVINGTKLVLDKEGNKGCHESQAKCSDVIVHCNEYDTGFGSLGVHGDSIAAGCSQGSEKSGILVSSIAK